MPTTVRSHFEDVFDALYITDVFEDSMEMDEHLDSDQRFLKLKQMVKRNSELGFTLIEHQNLGLQMLCSDETNPPRAVYRDRCKFIKFTPR